MRDGDESITLPMRAAGICATELLQVLDGVMESRMPLAPYSLLRLIHDKITPRGGDERQYLVFLAATALLMAAAIDPTPNEGSGS